MAKRKNTYKKRSTRIRNQRNWSYWSSARVGTVKNVPVHEPQIVNLDPVTTEANSADFELQEAPPIPLATPQPAIPSTSKDVVDVFNFADEVPQIQDRQPRIKSRPPVSTKILEGRRIVALEEFVAQIQRDRHSGGAGCSFMDSEFISEQREGLKSVLMYRCRMCNKVTRLRTDAPGSYNTPINEAVVLGTIAGGGGYASLAELTAAANVPCMSNSTYTVYEQRLAPVIEDACLQTILEAGEEEKRQAILAGDVDSQGVPLVTVVCDGIWGKRSYKNKYDSLSGTAIIAGLRTAKILFYGVRNKYCSICATHQRRGEPSPEHTCFKNWTESSTSMEADIIVEGFKSSMAMHGVKYHQFIGDGDSNTHRRILESNPYDFNPSVVKVECKNHLLRNFRSALRDLGLNTKRPCPPEMKKELIAMRKEILAKYIQLSAGISKACQYRHNQEGPLTERTENLKADILNSPSHVFGSHSRCAPYFCDKEENPEDCIVPRMVSVGLWPDIMKIVNSLANHVGSLLFNSTNNVVENANSVVAKYLSGKRMFYSRRGSYNVRCAAAVLSLNSRHSFIGKVQKHLKGHSRYGSFTEKFENQKKVRLANSRKRRLEVAEAPASKRANRYIRPTYGPDEHYGLVELDEGEIDKQKQESFLKSLEVTAEQREALQTQPQGTGVWRAERQKRLTASNFGLVCRRRETTSCKTQVHTILYANVETSDMVHGRVTEEEARDKLANDRGIVIEQAGLFIDEDRPYLAASPDGLVGTDTLVEIKCPPKASEYKTVAEAVQAGKLSNYLEKAPAREDKVKLKTLSHAYYQIQGQLHITKRSKCIFYMYCTNWQYEEEIMRDDQFWAYEMEEQLEKFYMQALLPELLDSRFPIRNRKEDIREAPFVEEARKGKLPKKGGSKQTKGKKKVTHES